MFQRQTSLAHYIITHDRPRRSPLRPIRLDSEIAVESPMSPDEQIIQLRGPLRSSPRRKTSTPIAASTDLPDLDASLNASTASSKGGRTPVKSKTALEGVRKRLLMSGGSTADDDTSFPTELSPSISKKRKRMTKKSDQSKLPCLKKTLWALSSDQLISLIEDLVSCHPELESEVVAQVPAPDISSLVENLEYFRRNTLKSLPYSRWGSSRDAFCYRRVKTHVESFKSACISQGKHLQDSESWEASIDYVLKAWTVLDEMPTWDNPAHNKPKEMCYRTLAGQCKKAIKASSLNKQKYQDILERIQETLDSSTELHPCLELVEKKIKKCEDM